MYQSWSKLVSQHVYLLTLLNLRKKEKNEGKFYFSDSIYNLLLLIKSYAQHVIFPFIQTNIVQ